MLPLTPQEKLLSGFAVPAFTFGQFLLIMAMHALVWMIGQRFDLNRVLPLGFPSKGSTFDTAPYKRTSLAILLSSFNIVCQTIFNYL